MIVPTTPEGIEARWRELDAKVNGTWCVVVSDTGESVKVLHPPTEIASPNEMLEWVSYDHWMRPHV